MKVELTSEERELIYNAVNHERFIPGRKMEKLQKSILMKMKK